MTWYQGSIKDLWTSWVGSQVLHQSLTFLFSPTAVEARLHIRELTFDSTGSEPPDTGGEGGGGKRSRRDPEPYPPSQPTPTWGLTMSVSRVRPAQTATSFGCRWGTTAWTSPQGEKSRVMQDKCWHWLWSKMAKTHWCQGGKWQKDSRKLWLKKTTSCNYVLTRGKQNRRKQALPSAWTRERWKNQIKDKNPIRNGRSTAL